MRAHWTIALPVICTICLASCTQAQDAPDQPEVTPVEEVAIVADTPEAARDAIEDFP